MITNNKILAIFDIDKTLKPGYSIIDFAKFLTDRGMFAVQAWNDIERDVNRYKSQEIDYNEFANLIVEDYGRGVAGKKLNGLIEQSEIFWQEYMKGIFGYVDKLFSDLRAAEAETVALSGSPRESLIPLLTRLKFNKVFVTEYEVLMETFTGKIIRNAASHKGKEELVESILGGDDYNVTFGFGDSAADIAFLSRVDHPFVIGRHDAGLVQMAEKLGWAIVDDASKEIDIEALLVPSKE